MTVTAFITSALTSKAKLSARRAMQREQEIKTYYTLSRRLNEEIELPQIARLAAEVLSNALNTEISCLCLNESEQPASLYRALPGQSALSLPCGDLTVGKESRETDQSEKTVSLPLQNKGVQLAVLQMCIRDSA